MSRIPLFLFSLLLSLNFYLPTSAHPLSQLRFSFTWPLRANQTTPTGTIASHIDGYCKRNSQSEKWYCERKGFVCGGFNDDEAKVCVDRRSIVQKEADRQEAADGKDGRCNFRYEVGYYCTQKGFECVDGRTCEDRRTDWERYEDDGKEREWNGNLALIVFFSICGIFVFALLLAAICHCCALRWKAPTEVDETSQEEQGTGWRGEEQKEKDITLLDRTDKAEDTAEAERCATLDGIRAVEIVVEDKHELPGYSE